jgi:hypothetical protein
MVEPAGRTTNRTAIPQRYQEARAYLDHLKRDLSESSEALPAVSAAWLAQAEVSVEELNPGAKRVQRLLNGYEPSEWRAPFGDPIVWSYPGSEHWHRGG